MPKFKKISRRNGPLERKRKAIVNTFRPPKWTPEEFAARQAEKSLVIKKKTSAM